ncbi:MAG: hypothetical protein RLZZ306_304 [Bacteroidota bacterium]|jgi:hypothetical protein
METYENEQRNQMGNGDLSTQETDPRTQQQQANDGMMSPKSGNMNEDDEEMDDETMIDDDDIDDEEMEREDNQGTGGGMTRESGMNRGTMSAS